MMIRSAGSFTRQTRGHFALDAKVNVHGISGADVFQHAV